MVLWRKCSEKGKLSPFMLLILSLAISIVLSIPFFLITSSYMHNHFVANISLLSFLIFIIGLLLTIIFILSGVLLNRVDRERAYVRELRNFKNFTDALHRVSSEIGVYKILFAFICNMPLVGQTTLFYRNGRASNDNAWKKVTNENTPLCNMEPKDCPLINLGRECYVENIEKGMICAYQQPEYKSGSYICIPIIDEGYQQSILQLYSKTEHFFDEETISEIKSYIEIAALVLNNKRTLHSLNKKACTDKLTKLYNRGFLDTYLENQIEAANLSNQQLCLIIVDIDNFKAINDSFGHTAGDHVLMLFSELLLKCTRKTDLVARYGGDEFIVILPSTNIETAEIIAERIRKTVSETYIPPVDGKEIPPISCSLGLSTYPEHCDSKNSLIKKSDTALYKAKQSGRNCTKVFDPKTMLNI